jgi:hypothetical protein
MLTAASEDGYEGVVWHHPDGRMAKLDGDLTRIGQHRLGAPPVAGVAPVPTERIVLVVTQMLSHLLL